MFKTPSVEHLLDKFNYLEMLIKELTRLKYVEYSYFTTENTKDMSREQVFRYISAHSGLLVTSSSDNNLQWRHENDLNIRTYTVAFNVAHFDFTPRFGVGAKVETTASPEMTVGAKSCYTIAAAHSINLEDVEPFELSSDILNSFHQLMLNSSIQLGFSSVGENNFVQKETISLGVSLNEMFEVLNV